MVEAMLGLMIGLGLLTFMMRYQVQAQDDMRAKNTAESLQSFSQMAAQYLVSNRAAIKTAISGTPLAAADAAAAEHCVVRMNPTTGAGGTVAVNRTAGKMTCAIDIALLKYKRLLPAAYPETNAYNQRWTAIYRLVYGDYDNNPVTPETTNGDIEILVVGATNDGQERSAKATEMLLTADIMGGNGGVVPMGKLGNCEYSTTDPTKRAACGVGGAWSVDVSSFTN